MSARNAVSALALDRAAYNAIGQKAQTSGEAYSWLKTRAVTGDSDEQARVLAGLAVSGREDVAGFLALDVFPVVEGVAKRTALEVYAHQPDADASVLARLTDPAWEADPQVRATAALQHLLVSRDIEGTVTLVEAMVHDPDADVSFAATLVMEQYLQRRGDADAVQRWAQLASLWYRAKRAASGIDVRELLGKYTRKNLERARQLAVLTKGTPAPLLQSPELPAVGRQPG